MKTRFAPSPTYYLHLGHAASALHVWTRAEALAGEVLLRIEDIDTTRCRPDYTQAIYEDLSWLGLSWPQPVRIQSEHFDEYAAAVQTLTARGLTYRCFRTRSELAACSDPKQPGPHAPDVETAHLEAGDAFAWRLSLSACRDQLGPVWSDLAFRVLTDAGVETQAARPDIEGDIVLARKDSPSAYHLAATHDDAVQGITHIVRGVDLIDAPHVQTLLQVLMGWPHPIYQHHDLVLDADGNKLSKRARSATLRDLRADGVTPAQIRTRLGFT